MDTAEIIKSGTIADRYEILELLGRGGMSVVYKARHQLMNRIVAIKMLHSRLLKDQPSVKRFQNESQAASALSHPNLITVFDFGIIPGGIPYLVMDFVEGKSLSDILDVDANLEVQRAVGLFRQVCSGLAHAQSKGVLHRDLKPSNIMLTRHEDEGDWAKVVDFGIATFLPESGQQIEKLTAAGEFCGTAAYMSPEHCRGKELDGRADIYSMGCVMYECLTGLPPFVGDNILDTMQKQIGEVAAPFSVIRPDLQIPAELEAIVFKALEKNKENRYQTFDELKKALTLLNEQLTGRPLSQSGTHQAVSDCPAALTTEIDASSAHTSRNADTMPASAVSYADSRSNKSIERTTEVKQEHSDSATASAAACAPQNQLRLEKPLPANHPERSNISAISGATPSEQDGRPQQETPSPQKNQERSGPQSVSEPMPGDDQTKDQKCKSTFPIGGDVLVVLLLLGACIVLPMLRGGDNSSPRMPIAAETILTPTPQMQTSDSVPTAATESEWKSLSAEASKAYDDGKYAEAEKLYRKAAAVAERFGQSDKRYVLALRRIADTFYVRGDDAKATEIDKKVESLQHHMPGSDPTEKAVSSPDLSDSGAAGRSNSAQQSDTQVASDKSERQKTTDRLAELARDCHKHGQCDTAEQLLIRSVHLAEDVFGADSKQAEARRKDLATFYMSMGEYDKAKPLLSKVMSKKSPQ